MRTIGDFTTAKAGGAGFALSALNPKNVLLTVAAAAEIAEVGLPAGQQIAVLLGFVLLASAGVLTPLVLSLALGDRSRELLDGLRGWMARHNAVIMAVLFLLIGAKLIGDAVSRLLHVSCRRLSPLTDRARRRRVAASSRSARFRRRVARPGRGRSRGRRR